MNHLVSEVIGPPAPQIVPESLENFHKNQSLRLSDLRGRHIEDFIEGGHIVKAKVLGMLGLIVLKPSACAFNAPMSPTVYLFG